MNQATQTEQLADDIALLESLGVDVEWHDDLGDYLAILARCLCDEGCGYTLSLDPAVPSEGFARAMNEALSIVVLDGSLIDGRAPSWKLYAADEDGPAQACTGWMRHDRDAADA
ncbi:hypothetical protein [Georgenia yuyongxinii]